MAFQYDEDSNWSEFRKLPNHREIDFHWATDGDSFEHWRAMAEVGRLTLRALQDAQRSGASYLLLLHGCTSSSDGETQTTARSVIRGLMRSKTATPYIVRSQCIQHHSCFVAAIRPLATVRRYPIDLQQARAFRRSAPQLETQSMRRR